MKQIVLLATGTLLSCSIAALAQQDGTWRMHEGMGWGWGGMWLGPLFMLAALALLVAIVGCPCALAWRRPGGGS